MTTECNEKHFEFHLLGAREVRANFDGGAITSDGSWLLLREVEKRTGIVARFAGCFTDPRDAERIEHRVGELVAQRVYGLARGYEDLNDHDERRQEGRFFHGYYGDYCYLPLLEGPKIGALIRVTLRKVWIALAGGYPSAEVWARIWAELHRVPVWCGDPENW